MLLKNIVRLSINPTFSYAPIQPFFFSASGSLLHRIQKTQQNTNKGFKATYTKIKNRPFINLLNTQRFSFCDMRQFYNSFYTSALQNYPSVRDVQWKNSLIQSLNNGADVSFLQIKLQQPHELRFIIKQNRLTTFQSFNQYIITPKSQVKSDKRLNKENKLKSEQASAYINKVIYENPKREKYTEKPEKYRVHKVATASISKNLKDLFAKCDLHPGEYCFATPRKKSEYEFIDFIIAKKQLDKYQIFTFDASILNKKAKIKDAKALFADLFSRQKGKSNYIINHVVLCHKDAKQSIPCTIKKNFNIFCSPWDDITFRSSNNKLSLTSFFKMRETNNMQNETLKSQEKYLEE